MDRNSVPNSPSHKDDEQHHQQAAPRMQATPPSAFPFPGLPPGAQPVLNQPGAYPMQAHVLFDPVTGQHYIVPQPYYQPIQPMYYPPPQPPNQPAHMYYPYPKQPQQPQQQQQPVYMGMYSPANSRPATSTNDGPTNDEKSEVTSEDAMSTTSNISARSFSLMQNPKIPQFGSKRENSREYMFRSPTANPPPFILQQQQQHDYEQPMRSPRPNYENPFVKLHRLESDSARGGTQSDFEGKPSPKFAYPTNSSSSDVETSRRFGRSQKTPSTPTSSRRMVEEESLEEQPVIVEEQRKPRIPAAKSVRMEINFDDVPVVPEEKKMPRRSNATAFTVNLDSKEKDLSLQEAARNLAENRRNKKIVKMASHEEKPAESLPASRANKNYLLEKLLTGKNSNDYDNGESATVEGGSEVGSRTGEDFDMRSEALTFVIDTSKRSGQPAYYSQNQYQSKVVQFSDDDESDSDSESEVMQQYSQRSEPPAPPAPSPPQRPVKLTTPSPPPVNTSKPFESRISRPSTSKTSPRPTSGTSDFLQELAKLRLMAGLPASGPGGSVSESDVPKRSNFRRAETSSARAPTVSSTQKVNARASFSSSRPRETGATTTTPTPSRKSETRRSLTGTSSPQLSGMTSSQRPPFRSAARGILLGQSEEQREQERNAWLRRKDYNPMKAAAAARKPSTDNNSPKSREQQFQSRRSITLNTINNDPFAKKAPQCVSRPTRNRSQEPRRRPADEQKLSGLAKAVDMLSAKCKKSIELIRLQNKGCLSVSVEDLLQTASEAPRPNESLDEQLERLSDAFDAVQRYLEQSPLDGFNSPTPDTFYDDDDVTDSKSTFSGVSTHQENRPTESISSSYRKKVLDS